MFAMMQIVAGLILLVGGAEFLVRGAARLARMLGLSPFAIGVTVVAFGTSAPELFASIQAAREGTGDLGIGNVVGSNIANVLLILGVTALISPTVIEKRVLQNGLPIMLVISVAVAAMLWLGDQTLGRIEGGVLVLGLLGYVIYSFVDGKEHPDALAHEYKREVKEDLHLNEPEPRSRLMLDLLFIVIGLLGLSFGAQLLVAGASTLAIDVLGVSPGLVGLTVVAFGTSLPELAASIRAALTKQHAMAVGNVVGSNVFNLLSVLGIASLFAPMPAREGIGTDLVVMLLAAVLCYPVLLRARLVGRVQGAVMLLLYVGYVGYLAVTALPAADG